MKDLIQAHKKLIKTVKEQMGFSDYGMYWLAFLEGGLTIWLLDRIFFHWLSSRPDGAVLPFKSFLPTTFNC